jgi:AAA+ ATPase superfamily predicted ATPase
LCTFYDRPINDLTKLYGFNHKEAVKRLKEVVDKGTFSIVLGARRVGKTSVVKTFLKHYSYKYLYFDLSPYIGQNAVSFQALTPTEIGFNEKELASEAQLNISIVSLRIREAKITGDVFQSNLISLLRDLNSKYKKFIIVFDEAQVLAFLKGINVRGLIQLIHNNYSNISVILTGSMPGLLEKVISPTTAAEPSFARYFEKIYIPRWTKEETIDFLKNGFLKNGIRADEIELEEVYEELSGIPGFIVYYGLLRTSGKSHEKALENTIEYAISLWKKDIDSFIKIYDSPLYVEILKILARTITGASWSEIKGELETKRMTTISKSLLSRLLQNLLGAGMIEKLNGKYVVADRALKKAVLRLRIK